MLTSDTISIPPGLVRHPFLSSVARVVIAYTADPFAVPDVICHVAGLERPDGAPDLDALRVARWRAVQRGLLQEVVVPNPSGVPVRGWTLAPSAEVGSHNAT